jgi:nucleotide-binding universal stress UspA family protein
MTSQDRPIVVGIDGSEGATQAVDWALTEARQRNLQVQLVYAYGSAAERSGGAVDREFPDGDVAIVCQYGEDLIQQAVAHAATIASDVTVSGRVVADDATHGHAMHALVQASRAASMVVVGSRRRPLIGTFLVGSVGAGVALRTSCPVIVVRGPRALEGERHGVVAGVDGREGSQRVLSFAFDFASRHGVPLRAILCWHSDMPAEMMWRLEPPPPERADAILAEAMAGWREKFPDVDLHTAVVRGHVAQELVSASSAEELLVVGRSGRRELVSTLLGSATMGVLHHATCPVAVVPDAV